MGLRPAQGDEERSVWQPLSMERLPSPLSSRAKPRDLQFRGPFVEMFFDRASWLPAVSANNTQSEAACEQTKRLDRQVQ
jgi:hypothetical protein